MRFTLSVACFAVIHCGGFTSTQDLIDAKFGDFVSPLVSSVTPSAGATDISDQTTVQITFNETMDADSINAGTLIVAKSNQAVSGTVLYDAAARTATWTPGQRLITSSVYEVTVSGVRDRAGNKLKQIFKSTFTTDACPSPGQTRVGFDGTIRAITRAGCIYYVGGEFTTAGTMVPGGVMLDRNTGTFPLGLAREEINGYVTIAISDGAGGFYISGEFTAIGGVARGRLARISADGRLHSFNPPTLNNSASAMILVDSTIYLGGSFTAIGDVARNNFAAIDTAGNLLAFNPNPNNAVSAIFYSGGWIFFGGTFTTVSGQTRNRLAAVDASGNLAVWNPSMTGASPIIVAINQVGNDLIVGGNFNMVSGTSRANAAALDIGASCMSSFVVGTCLLAWNPNFTGGWVQALAVNGNTIIAAGGFNTVGVARNGLAAFTYPGAGALNWNPATTGGTTTTLAMGSDRVYIGGAFTTVGAVNRSKAAAVLITSGCLSAYTDTCVSGWNPNLNNQALTLSLNSDTVFIGGGFTAINNATRSGLAAFSTDGTLLPWTGVAAAPPMVYALTVRNGVVYVGGSFATINGIARGNIAAIDSDATLLPWHPNVNGTVRAFALTDDGLIAGGDFTLANVAGTSCGSGGLTRNRLAAFNYSDACLLNWDPNAGGAVYALRAKGNSVYAGGTFTTIGAQPRNRIARISSSNSCLSTYSTGACLESFAVNVDNNVVRAIAVSDTRVYFGGDFTTIGGAAIARAASADLAGNLINWSPGTIATGNVLALEENQGIIYAAGGFSNYFLAVTAAGGVTFPSGISSPVNALHLQSTRIMAAGAFTSVGTKLRDKVAGISLSGDSVVW